MTWDGMTLPPVKSPGQMVVLHELMTVIWRAKQGPKAQTRRIHRRNRTPVAKLSVKVVIVLTLISFDCLDRDW